MAIVDISNKLGVLKKFDDLVGLSIGESSVYIRTKETLGALVASGDIKAVDKAKVLSDVLSKITTSVTSSAMATALAWEKEEKEIAFKKLEAAKKLDLLDEEILLKQAQNLKARQEIDNLVVQKDEMIANGISDRLIKAKQLIKTDAENILLASRLKESQATVHKIVADTYTNFGSFTYSLDINGMATAPQKTSGSYQSLSDYQKTIADKQSEGYKWNAWANAVTGSSSMLGALIGSGLVTFTDNGNTTTADRLLRNVMDATANLKNAN